MCMHQGIGHALVHAACWRLSRGIGRAEGSEAPGRARQSDYLRGDASSEGTSWPGTRRFLEGDSEEDDRRSPVVREKGKMI